MSDTYFISMIAIVCISVISTGFVMHISGLSQPMPRWIKRLFLDIIPRFLCLSVYSDVDPVQFEERLLDKTHEDKNDVTENGINDTASDNGISVGNINKGSFLEDDFKVKWRRLSIIIDRMLLYLFSLLTIVCTLYLSIQVTLGSGKEYDEILQDLDDNWPYGV